MGEGEVAAACEVLKTNGDGPLSASRFIGGGESSGLEFSSLAGVSFGLGAGIVIEEVLICLDFGRESMDCVY